MRTTTTPEAAPRVVILDRGDGVNRARVTVLDAGRGGTSVDAREVDVDNLAELVAELDDGVRWVWDSTAAWYPALVEAGVRVARCHDLRLARRILRGSELAAPASALERLPADPAWDEWDGGWAADPESTAARLAGAQPEPDALFTGETFRDTQEPGERPRETGGRSREPGEAPRDAVAEWRRQLDLLAALAVDHASSAHRLRLLVAAESAGALAAVELHHDGLPFRRDIHEQTLAGLLGPRPQPGARPAGLDTLAQAVRDILDAPRLNPDSLPHLLRELRRNGLDVTSTARWELAHVDHPVVAPLTEYKRRSRLMSANGWAWLDAWVSGDRFRPDYVPAGVVTGRWSSRGGGALSLPHVIRDAVRAREGWRIVVVDAAQLEPRILAAMSRDNAMLAAGEGRDLYGGLVEAGVVDSRAHAKVGMLAVLYGGTSGDASVLLPRLSRAYPRAMGLVDAAARAGEAGGVVTTWLGRSSPPPGQEWRDAQAAASQPGAGAAEESRARSRARDWGRFTRNFVVQGSAAEWVLAWQAGVRLGLQDLVRERGIGAGAAPHLAFFLHDELLIHTPAELAERVTEIVGESARAASLLLFPHLDRPGLVPLDVAVVRSYSEVDAPESSGEPEAGDPETPGARSSRRRVTESAVVPGASGTARNPSAS